MRAIILCVCVLLNYSLTNVAAEWPAPYFEVANHEKVAITKEETEAGHGVLELAFDEEVDEDFLLGVFTYPGTETVRGVPATKFSVSQNAEGKYELRSVLKFDFESGNDLSNVIQILAGTDVVGLKVVIRNINDNAMVITAGSCTIEEGPITADSHCDTYTIFDDDGISDKLSLNNLGSENPESKIFEFSCLTPCKNGEKDATIRLSLKTKLDYETVTRYNFDWIVTDGKFSDNARVQVNVKDMPDQDPVWTTITKSIQFEEMSEQTFTFTAIDGDAGIDDEILYKCLEVPPPLDTEMDCIPDGKSLTLNIKPIDRDKENLNILKFKVRACEKSLPDICTVEDIAILIDDINNKCPTITLSADEITLKENTYQTIDIDIDIKDLDLSDKGTFDVNLVCDDVKEVESALQVIPGTGYREGAFSLSIINAAILDYDRVDKKLQEFEIKIVATEKANSSHIDVKPVLIRLQNLNDHVPIFKRDSYGPIEIYEDFGRTGSEPLDIEDLIATDADYDDYVTYALVGSITKILKLEEPQNEGDGPKISSIEANNPFLQLFDYEKQEVVTFQVEASDNFDKTVDPNAIPNKKYAEITIKVLDINDEPPVITLSKNTIEIEENRNTGANLGITVTAYDPDTQPDLNVKIDWDKSYATKYGLKKQIFKDEYVGSFILNEIAQSQQQKTYEITVNDVKPIDGQSNTPDYEEFDTIYLYLVVTDDAQALLPKTSEVILIITVEDLNDNKPEFVREVMDIAKKIKEKPDRNAPIGMVAAKDDDVNNKLTFSLKAKDDYAEGKISVNQDTRMLEVSDESIDAEDLFNQYGKKYLEYDIIVSDVDHETCEKMDIFVEDENDEIPYFVNEMELVDFAIDEHKDIDGVILTVVADDDDRDAPNNIVSYFIQPTQYLAISDKGKVTVVAALDREEMENFKVTVLIKDNPDNPKMQKQNSIEFTITLNDINDNEPEILTDKIETSEKIEENEVVFIVEAFDKDEVGNDNAKIDFEILGIEGCYKDLKKDFFKIETDADYLTGKGTITAQKPLKNMYSDNSDCKMKIKTTDFGNPQQSDTKEIPFIIDKFNFEKPEFTYPNKKSIYLKPIQDAGKKVRLHDDTEMPAIAAKHERENKYDIAFSLASDSDGIDTFELRKTTQTTAHMYLKANYDHSKSYNVKIVAQDNGEPPLSNTYEVKIGFYDTDKEPVFEENDRNIEIKFDEDEGSVGKTFELPKASMEVDDEDIEANIDIYYHIYEDKNGAFQLNKNADPPTVTLTKPLLVLDLASKELKVVATKSASNIPSTVDPASIVTIKLEVIDINNNPPVFKEKQYSSGVMEGDKIGADVRTVEAIDLDEYEDKVLTYSILMDTFDAIGEGISKQNTFNIDPNTGVIQLNFEVLQNMKGYFIFDVEVTDSKFKDKTNVKIYIISNENEVALRFDNTYDEIITNRKNIENILSEVLEYNCAIHGVSIASDESGNPMDDVSEVKIHCIDRTTNLPVPQENIKAQMNNAQTISKLKEGFRDYFLRISEIREVIIPENMEEQLKIWLVCVSVVMGSLCVVLVLAFILKTRSLMARISKLTTVDFTDDEKNMANSNINVPAAPNTNRRAVEGSNPVFNTNFEEREDNNNYDNQSISSGDSDFLGIENNPAFDS